MPYRKEEFINGEIYHITLRAIDNNLIFKDIDDYYRGIFSIYEFNNTQPIKIRERRKIRARLKKAAAAPSCVVDKRDRPVDILLFCLMPNHIHLLTKQLKSGGIEKFMRKVGTGYAGYFNKKYNRKGYVFQNRFSAVRIKNQEQLKTVFVYIHTNPIALAEPNWKEKGIKNPKKIIKFLKNYKWSSYLDYLGRKNFPSVTERKFILKVMNEERNCKEFVDSWVKLKKEIKEFPKIALE